MTEQEKMENNNYEMDKIKREELINTAINIPFTNNQHLQKPSKHEIKEFYINHFSEYGKYCVLPFKKYIMAEFWFNDAGFQFKWRNHKINIQLECISWNEVFKRLKTQ